MHTTMLWWVCFQILESILEAGADNKAVQALLDSRSMHAARMVRRCSEDVYSSSWSRLLAITSDQLFSNTTGACAWLGTEVLQCSAALQPAVAGFAFTDCFELFNPDLLHQSALGDIKRLNKMLQSTRCCRSSCRSRTSHASISCSPASAPTQVRCDSFHVPFRSRVHTSIHQAR